jgi:putative PIN family toxin of toxin-antitoxin system
MADRQKTRVVIDTNVLLSAIIADGTPARVVSAARAGAFRSVTSVYVLDELRSVLIRTFDHSSALAEERALAVARFSEVMPVTGSDQVWCTDPADDAVIATALLGRASVIVTGDRKLRRAEVEGLEILTPGEFLDRLG